MSGILSPTSSIMEDENPGDGIMQEQILNTLDELNEEEFERYKWFLQRPENLSGLPTLKKKNLEKAKTFEIVDLMVQTYNLSRCLEVTCQILKKINRNDLYPRLLKSKKPEIKVDQIICNTGVKIQEIKESVKISKNAADREKAEGVEVFTALKESAERGLKELIKEIEDKQKTEEKKTEDWIKYLKYELNELMIKKSQLNQLSQSEDHLLQSFSFLKAAPPSKNWTEVRIRPPSYEGTVVRAVAQLEEKVRENMEKMMKAEMKRVQQSAVDLTLDPDTAQPKLIMSVDGKQVNVGEVEYHLPDNPKRFSESLSVLGSQSFSSGRFYFEVQVKGTTGWVLGVASESIDRKGIIPLCPKNGYWTIRLKKRNNYKACAVPPVRLHLHPGPEKVGVFVDYEEGLVSFYDVDGLIYSFTGWCLTDKLYPFFSPYDKVRGKNSAPLIICPVRLAECSSYSSDEDELNLLVENLQT
ncbi:pyrin-like [Cyprinodon tularosa]|uniref:pyrin-like n=1 Tax=Cyprinodon tularosa TaxID=77115 RepID=UPI0018E26BD3|nr:pyrin-like [Cyprinodon tularosa]